MFAHINGIRLHYEEHEPAGGDGAASTVVMLMGTGSRGRVWHLHQVPALLAAGYRVVTVDNRGIPPSDACAQGFTLQDMVADVAGLIAVVSTTPCIVIGTSMGATIAAELAAARPELVAALVLLAARGRSDALQRALQQGERDLVEAGVVLPSSYRAAVHALQYLSRTTTSDDRAARDWLDLFEHSPQAGPGVLAQQRLSPLPDRLAAYASISVPTLVVSFEDDLITPPHLGAEVAAVIAGARFEEIPACGHFGYLEAPAAVNTTILRFLSHTALPCAGDPRPAR